MSKNDLPYYVALAAAPGIGPVRFKVLLQHFKSAEAIWEAPEKVISKILTPALFKQFVEFRKNFDIESYLAKISKSNIRVITLEDKNYPKLLKEIADPPPVLYVKGEIETKSESETRTVAVVGTRKMTNYGSQVTEI